MPRADNPAEPCPCHRIRISPLRSPGVQFPAQWPTKTNGTCVKGLSHTLSNQQSEHVLSAEPYVKYAGGESCI